MELSNWGWRVRLIGPAGERRLFVRGVDGAGTMSVAEGGQFTIASCDAKETKNSAGTECLSSDLRVDYNPKVDGMGAHLPSYDRIAPRNDPAGEVSADIPIANSTNPDPAAHLDLVHGYSPSATPSSATDKFIVTDSTDSPQQIGDFFLIRPASIPLLVHRQMASH